MKPLFRIPLILFIILSIFSCNRNRIIIKEFAPQGEVQELQSFTIEFSEEVAPADQMDEWLSEAYVDFDPPIQGRFKWLTTTTLLFSPDRALQPSQKYTAKVNAKKVLTSSKKSGKFDTYSFHTPYFKAVGVEFFWKQIPKAEHEVSVQANLSFSYEVAPDELRNYLSVSKGGTELTNYRLESDQAAKVIALSFGTLPQTESAQEFKVVLRKGLNSVLNRSPLPRDSVFSFTLPGITRLSVISANSGFDGDNGWIEVHTTQAVDQDQLSKYIELSPRPGKLTYTVTDNRLRIEGAMVAGSQVSLRVKKGLPGLYGGTLEDEYTENIVLADLEPELRFADRLGTYLLRGGLENVRVEATNVSKAKLEVYEVYKNNLLFFFYNNWDYRSLYYNRHTNYSDNTQSYHVNYYGKQLYEEHLEFEDLRNQRQGATVNLKKALGQRFKGIYIIQVNSDKDYWRRDAKLVAISDIGLIAKYTGTELFVFANSLRTAEPMEGVDIQLISANNQTLISGKTDAEGIAKFTNLKNDVEGFTPRMITAELGDDFNFVDLEATRIETSRFDVGGKFIAADSYDCFVYSDRNIYRPGETAYLSAILRKPDMGTVTEIPVGIKIISPTGKTFNEYQKTVNNQGSFELSVDLPDFAQTGQYIAEFYTGSDELLSSYRFNVEEFAPDKIRVNLTQDKEELLPGQQLDIAIQAEYLFGAPAAEHKYEMDVRLDHRSFVSKSYPDFDFASYSTKNSYIENDFTEGQLDSEGKTLGIYKLPTNINSGGYILGRAFVSVFDVTGRTVNRTTSFKAYPKNFFPGIRSQAYYYGTNKNIRFDLIAVNPKDEALSNFEAEVELVRYEWATVLERNSYNGRYHYRSVEKEIKEWKRPVKFSAGATPYTFQASQSGRYELRLYKKGHSDYVKKRFYAYQWGSATASSFEINKEGQVEIILDKEEYEPGQTAKVLFVTPFTGKMLVTVERGEVMEYMYIDVEKNSTEVPILLDSKHIPNVYISATLFRPHQANDNAPFLVGHGYKSVSVSSPDNRLDIEIEAPEKIKPRTTQYVTIKTDRERDIFVTLAVVDEGILQVKNFQTPDPYAYMYAKRGLGVESYDLYEYLLPEIGTSSPAGGDEVGSGRRLNPVKARRFKLLSQWSGIRQTNSRGEVKIPVEIPQYNGEVRLMVVAYKGRRFGSAAKSMKVADDIIMMPSIPRFLSMNDSLVMPVTVMNTTDKKGEVSIRIGVEGPLSIGSGKSASLKLAANESKQVQFVIRSGSEIGTGKITLSSSGMDKVMEEIEIAVRPISPLIVDSDGGSIKAGTSTSLQVPKDFISSTQRSSISMSTFPAMKFGRHLRYLVGYPHGCLEQTTSKLFPQLYFSELASLVAPDKYVKGNPVYYVKEGIHKLQGMSRYDGSFNYWAGGTTYNWWGTVYATHFLLEARNAGYVVNEEVLQRALTFLTRKAADKSTYDYIHFTGSSRKVSKIANKEIIYSLYVLALAGKPDISIMNYYRARPNLLSNDSRYLLAGAFALAKNYNAYNDIIPLGYKAEQAGRTTGGSFDSEARANAIMLNVLLDVDPTNKNIPAMVRYLSGLGNKIWSTQDRAWTFLALGKAASQQAQSEVKIEIQVGGKTLATLDKSQPTFSSTALNGQQVTLKATGTGESFFLWQSDGIKSQGLSQEVDNNMQVRRTYFDRNGQEVSEFRQGDLIVCRISLRGGERSAENIAITDMIPAGFEIENPRLTTSADLSWITQQQDKFTPDYLDVRDDRLVLFTHLVRQKSKYYFYLLRVVNTGTFQLPAIGAEAMYDPDYRSYHGAKLIRVK